MSAKTPSAGRILVAARSYSDAEAALMFLRPLLDVFPANLAGLLSDERTEELVVTARQQIVSASGTLLEVPKGARAREFAKFEARAFKTSLARLAAARARQLAFEMEIGDLVNHVCASVAGEDILLFGQRPLLRNRRRILLLSSAAGDERTRLRQLAETLAGAAGSEVAELSIDQEPVARLLARVDRSAAAAIIADFEHGPLRTEADLRLLLEAARCPVIVLGAGQIRRAK